MRSSILKKLFVKTIKLTMPFSLLAITFVMIGLVLQDLDQIYFGIVWLILSVIAFVMKKRSIIKNNLYCLSQFVLESGAK